MENQQFNPADIDNLPTDPEQIAQMMGGGTDGKQDEGASSGAEQADGVDAQAGNIEAGKAEGEQQQPDAKQDDEKTEKREGKKVPISALHHEREKTRRVREELAAAQARLEELQKAEPDAMAGIDLAGITDDDLEALEDFPAIAAAVKATKALAAKVQQLEAESAARAKAVIEDARSDEQEVIARHIQASPRVSHLSATLTPEQWQARVARIDDDLRNDPEFSDLSFSERIEKVADIYEARYGRIPVKAGEKSKSEIAAAATKALQRSEENFAPNSLTDLRGGVAPENDEVGNKSAVELYSMMDKMTPEQLDNFLAKHAH